MARQQISRRQLPRTRYVRELTAASRIRCTRISDEILRDRHVIVASIGRDCICGLEISLY